MISPLIITSEFTPFDIGPPSVWLEADRGVTLDGDSKASAWADQSGNGHHLAETTYRPLWVAGAMNAHPVLRFAQNRMLFADAFPQSSLATTLVILQPGANTSNYRVILFRDVSGAPWLSLDNTCPTIYWPSAYAVNAAIGNNVSIVGYSYDANTGATSTTINGGSLVQQATGAWQIGNWVSVGFSTGIPDTTQSLYADVSGIVQYPRILTADEITRFANGYRPKYGIAVA